MSPSPSTALRSPTIDGAIRATEDRLLEWLHPRGHWRGELASSALSTATAVCALLEVERRRAENGISFPAEGRRLADAGLAWLAANANPDGGWGDTVRSASNPSTTVLCWSAFGMDPAAGGRHGDVVEGAARWLRRRTGSLDPADLKPFIEGIYGEDRTFSIPILTLCALAGRLGPLEDAFDGVTALPFELAALPQSWFRFVGLPVVSYALPALIAVGQVQHRHRPSRNPVLRWLRGGLRRRTLDRLRSIQPSSGGFLEAVPLTSFVTLSLAGAGEANHPVVDLALDFLLASARGDGSWPIDEDLATWCTTLSIQGLAETGGLTERLDGAQRGRLREWLLDQQHTDVHPFTGAAPGGWAWTDLPGGVPDADDTPGALLALDHLRRADGDDPALDRAAESALGWLLDLQNRDGGLPTFCRGWGKLPFDRSSPDLTAHALRAFAAWRPRVPQALGRRLDRGARRAVLYLRRVQRGDGSFVPLWFGNEDEPQLENPTYGTARVLRAIGELSIFGDGTLIPEGQRAAEWLLRVQGRGGGWGGGPGLPPSVEETALALDALADWPDPTGAIAQALGRGGTFLAERIDAGDLEVPTPIGFYFANLWYFEALYPLAFSLAALGRIRRRTSD
ncbi:MAG: prenyltransferase/squalene oxidase repeat-containing protein [Acidobacteriota bacterium]